MVPLSILPCNLPSQLSANITCPASPFILLYGEAQILLALRIQTFLLPRVIMIFLKKCLLGKMCLDPILPDLSTGNAPYYFVHWGPRVASNNALSHWVWEAFLGMLIGCPHPQLPMEDDHRSFFAQLQVFEAKETVTSQSKGHQST